MAQHLPNTEFQDRDAGVSLLPVRTDRQGDATADISREVDAATGQYTPALADGRGNLRTVLPSEGVEGVQPAAVADAGVRELLGEINAKLGVLVEFAQWVRALMG